MAWRDEPDVPEDGWRVGALARLAGVSADTLRHYERKGVLPPAPRGPNGYRRYPAGALARVRLIRAALALGFTLDELAELLGERDRGRPPCRRVRELGAAKLAVAEERLAEITALVDSLRHVVDNWDDLIAGAGEGAPARLLESLTAPSAAPRRRPQLPPRPRKRPARRTK